ncbi:unnamed protein product [marine sediment metagenome]|uniref:Uncharacterized protein n=1 Tax=marine sediment metagenome TaxID=412755 RepID=X1N450_9ZZZZ
MNKPDDITFDNVISKANKVGWKRKIEIVETKDENPSKVPTYYAEVEDFYVVIGHSSEKGIRGYHRVHELRIVKSLYDYYSQPLIIFVGSNHLFRKEKRRMEKELNELELYLEKVYGEYDEQERLKELEKKKKEEEVIRNRLRRTFD